jgi:hypothetical protein
MCCLFWRLLDAPEGSQPKIGRLFFKKQIMFVGAPTSVSPCGLDTVMFDGLNKYMNLYLTNYIRWFIDKYRFNSSTFYG